MSGQEFGQYQNLRKPISGVDNQKKEKRKPKQKVGTKNPPQLYQYQAGLSGHVKN